MIHASVSFGHVSLELVTSRPAKNRVFRIERTRSLPRWLVSPSAVGLPNDSAMLRRYRTARSKRTERFRPYVGTGQRVAGV
eukprot:518745-Rhodomonas_salina.4